MRVTVAMTHKPRALHLIFVHIPVLYCRAPPLPSCEASAPSNDMPASHGPIANQVLVVAAIHTRLSTRFDIERAFYSSTEVLHNRTTEDIDRVCTFLLTDPGQPSMTRGDVRYLVPVDNVEALHTFLIPVLRESADGLRVDVETTSFMDKRDHAYPRSQVISGHDSWTGWSDLILHIGECVLELTGLPQTVMDRQSPEITTQLFQSSSE